MSPPASFFTLLICLVNPFFSEGELQEKRFISLAFCQPAPGVRTGEMIMDAGGGGDPPLPAPRASESSKKVEMNFCSFSIK